MKFHFPFPRRAGDSAPYLPIPSFIPYPVELIPSTQRFFSPRKVFHSNRPADFSDELYEKSVRKRFWIQCVLDKGFASIR